MRSAAWTNRANVNRSLGSNSKPPLTPEERVVADVRVGCAGLCEVTARCDLQLPNASTRNHKFSKYRDRRYDS